ncbi:hypothetical protein Q4485_01405 [Granulosicoccaceae sp. 1_MG-2023]|nr:hypothetical protein [Granulosicoccaceae sp. 1_MG-2023]
MGQVRNAGQGLTVCSGEVRAQHQDSDEEKVVALMQATIATVAG